MKKKSRAQAEGREGRSTTMAVLSALVRGAEDPVGAAKRSKQVFHTASLTDLDARIRFLAARLGLPEIHPARLGEAWSGVLTRKPSPSRRELLDLARQAVVTWDEPDPEIGSWRRALFSRLEPTLSSMRTLDTFGPETPPAYSWRAWRANGRPGTPERAAGEILRILEHPEGKEVTREAAHLAFLAGDIAVPRLLILCQSDDVDPAVRHRACESLGRLKARSAVEILLELLRRAPDVEEDEESRPEAGANLARDAARALAEIDPAFLLREPGTTAAKALARWALETGSLVFEDRVLGPDGRVTARAPQPEAGSSQAPRSPGRLDLHPDLQLVVRPIGDDDSRLMFELAVRDPRLGPRQDDFGPVALPQSARAFRKDLMLDLEDLTCKDQEKREISHARLAAKGATLFRLLPLGLQMWLWTLRDSERTLELFSEEPFLPWELIRLRPQGGGGEQGLFLCQAFTVTRWLRGLQAQLDFPLSRIALVAPRCDDLPRTLKERADILSFHVPGAREVIEIEPRYLAVMSALRSGEFDAWHFIGHAYSRAEDPDRWEFPLEGGAPLRPEDLKESGDFGRLRPWVFFNGCRTGGGGVSLDGTSGWAKRFLEAGAGAFIGTHWSVGDSQAHEVAIALYSRFLGGMPIGEALRKIREDLLEEDPLTALTYVAYAHPLAACR